MGMFNEVYKRCPIEGCGGLGYMQIYQIVLGFGGFYLDNPESIANELDEDQAQELKEAVESSKWFVCDKCKERFSILGPESTKKKIDIISSIGKNDSENEIIK